MKIIAILVGVLSALMLAPSAVAQRTTLGSGPEVTSDADAAAVSADRVAEMRKWYGRPAKPFAVMARDIKALAAITEPTPDEQIAALEEHREALLEALLEQEEDDDLTSGLETFAVPA